MKRVLTGCVAAVIEAWQELRIHKLRVLLSLIGVCLAVAAMSAAAALGDIGQQTLRESYERQGRPAQLSTGMWSNEQNGSGSGPRTEDARKAVIKVADRFDIKYWSIIGYGFSVEASTDAVATNANTLIVDEDFRDMRRLVIGQGRWLSEQDAQNRSPAVVINPALAKELGLNQGSLPTTISLLTPGGTEVDATVVGVTARSVDGGTSGEVVLLYDTYAFWFSQTDPIQSPGWSMWVPIPGADELAADVQRALSAELPGFQVDTQRSDYLAWDSNELDIAKWVVIAISSLILLLGAVSLLNVTVITMGQRVREIGVRRSFGATTGRVFFSVVMESVVATMVAGIVGVLLAIAIVSGPWTAKYLLDGIDDPPGFPFSAALLGIGAALAVGTIAGVVPALIAARVRIVNAIRF